MGRSPTLKGVALGEIVDHDYGEIKDDRKKKYEKKR